jgi:hypothetical protein
MIAAREDEVPDETFVAVDDEVPAEFFWFFVMGYELGGGHVAKVAADRLVYRSALIMKASQ